ncbi:hypothetical protein [Hahella ganghwensis]|uniref:hypothetical protein n=1 Tax=Hahella ganghwensis TaxID=286420 RepID=UPI000362AE3C|nr:hypothetical protein [Hahella ganghwensis]
MINAEDNPVEWALLAYELEEVIEHLQDLSTQLSQAGSLSEEEFVVEMGHVYSHLNRIWNSRNHIGDISDEKWKAFSQFPKDIDPVG